MDLLTIRGCITRLCVKAVVMFASSLLYAFQCHHTKLNVLLISCQAEDNYVRICLVVPEGQCYLPFFTQLLNE